MAVFRVEKNKNYTVMSNHHLKDKNLTLKSKGLLSVILSLPDEWNYTTRGLASICKEGVDCIGTALRELEASGYINRNQLRDELGRIKDTEYVIYEYPQQLSDDKPDMELPDTDYPCTENPYMDNPYMENTEQLNTNSINEIININTDLLNTHQSISFSHASNQDSMYIEPTDGIDRYKYYREAIKRNIEYDFLVDRQNKLMLDEIIEIILDHVYVKRDIIRIAGVDYPAEIVKERLLNLESQHIEYVIDCINKNTTKIRNIKAYILTALYNAPVTIDSYYTTLVNHDMAINKSN